MTCVIDMGMSLSTADLSRDPDDLRRVAGDLQRDVATLSTEIYAKTLLIEKLKMQLAVLRRARFGRSSERLDQAVEQLELLISKRAKPKAKREPKQQKRTRRLLPLRQSGIARRRAARPCPIICRKNWLPTSQTASVRPAAARSSARSAWTNARCLNMFLPTSSACFISAPK